LNLDSFETIDDIEAAVKGLAPDKLKRLLSDPRIIARIGSKCTLTEKQIEAEAVLNGPATHCILFGGSRSGKTFIIIRKIIERALTCKSRHAVLRYRFNHLKASIISDTLPKVMGLCFPGIVKQCKLDRSDWFYTLPNGSEVWFGGLDEKDRTEKVLGQEHASIFLNECSQIQFASRAVALTRLAQNTELQNKMFYDCNPGSRRHWTYSLFIDKINPNTHQPVDNPNNYAALQINPEHNRANLGADYINELEALSERDRRRFLLGIFADEDETALWTPEMLDNGRLINKEPPEMQRVVIAIDPSGCAGPEDLRSDEVGIIVAGLGTDGRGYILEDLSGRFGPDRWKTIVASAFQRHDADAVVAETNFGGAMVKEVMRTAIADGGLPIPFREVKASRGKIVRAEPIAALFQQGRVSLVGRFPELEFQLTSMTTAGYRGDRSPDRADSAIWALTVLFPAMITKTRDRSSPPKVKLGYTKIKRRH
jgi:predicted phage terminase large subunit-like protein